MPKVKKAPIDKYLKRIAVGMGKVLPLLDFRPRATRKRVFITLLHDAIRKQLSEVDIDTGKTYAALIGQIMLDECRKQLQWKEGQSGNPGGKPKPEEPSTK